MTAQIMAPHFGYNHFGQQEEDSTNIFGPSFTELLQSSGEKETTAFYTSCETTTLFYPTAAATTSYDTFVPRTMSPNLHTIQTYYDFGSESMGSPALPSATHSAPSVQSSIHGSPYVEPTEGWQQSEYWNLGTPEFGMSLCKDILDDASNNYTEIQDPISAIYSSSRSQSPVSPNLAQQPTQNSFPISRQSTIAPSDCGSSSSTIAMNERSRSPKESVSKDSPCPVCGKKYRDLKAHQLTHQRERPEKCPIPTCEYYTKGFARKYDCQRHTLTHYKGTMVCGFCPGSGSAAEKSFNRADVFKRHIASVHNVEQPPSNKKRSPNSSPRQQVITTGKCSTCGDTFSSAQQFYDHVDDCVYNKIVQVDPATLVNEKHLESIKLEDIDPDLLDTMPGEDEEMSGDEDIEFDESQADAEPDWSVDPAIRQSLAQGRSTHARSKPSKAVLKRSGSGASRQIRGKETDVRSGKSAISKSKRLGKTTRGKKRKSFPSSWGVTPEKMNTKRRCLFVYDGSTELIRDEMVMERDMEVKTAINGNADVTVSDLDFWTMQRAQAAAEAAPGLEVYM